MKQVKSLKGNPIDEKSKYANLLQGHLEALLLAHILCAAIWMHQLYFTIGNARALRRCQSFSSTYSRSHHFYSFRHRLHFRTLENGEEEKKRRTANVIWNGANKDHDRWRAFLIIYYSSPACRFFLLTMFFVVFSQTSHTKVRDARSCWFRYFGIHQMPIGITGKEHA